MNRPLRILAPLFVFAVVLISWQLAVDVLKIREVLLPSPFAVAQAFVSMTGQLIAAALRTMAAAAMGLTISTVCGVAIAFLFSQSPFVRTAFYPYAILLQTVPIIAVAPMVIIGFGRGLHSVTLIATILSLFPIITSTTTGLMQIDRHLLELFHLHTATRWQLFRKLRLPGALPYLINGMRIAGGAAIVGAIVGEFFVGSAQPGLGGLIQKKATGLHNSELYATVATATLLGILMFTTISLVGEFILKRYFGMSLQTSIPSETDTA